MAGAMTVTDTFINEKPVVQREYESGLFHPTAYMTAKMLADLYVEILFPTVYCTSVLTPRVSDLFESHTVSHLSKS